MEPTTSLQPMQVQRWLRSDPQDLRALLNALQHSYEDQKLSKQTKRPCPAHSTTHTHTHKHTHRHTRTHTLSSPFPSPVAFFFLKKTHIWVKLGVPYKKAPETCAKERTGAKCLRQTLWTLQKRRWRSRKFGWLVRLCRTEVRRFAGRKNRAETCKGKPQPLSRCKRLLTNKEYRRISIFPQERGFSICQRSYTCAVCDAHGARGVYQTVRVSVWLSRWCRVHKKVGTDVSVSF